jgi:hypothetical protein
MGVDTGELGYIDQPTEEEVRLIDAAWLEWHQSKVERRTLVARVLLISTFVCMLLGNLWMTERLHEAMLINVDQARLAQVLLQEANYTKLERLEEDITSIKDKLGVEPVMASSAAEPKTPEAVAEGDSESEGD